MPEKVSLAGQGNPAKNHKAMHRRHIKAAASNHRRMGMALPPSMPPFSQVSRA